MRGPGLMVTGIGALLAGYVLAKLLGTFARRCIHSATL